MTVLRIVLVIAAAIVAQTTLAVTLGPGAAGIDVVLVAVVLLALMSGPTAGLLSGTAAGLIQDAMGSGIVGIGGLGKSVVGYLAGLVGAQFIVARPLPRFFVFFAATLVDAMVVTSLLWVLSAHGVAVSLASVLQRALGQALLGLALLQLVEAGPRFLDQWRLNRQRRRATRLK